MRPDISRSRSSLAWGLGFLVLSQVLLAGWIGFSSPSTAIRLFLRNG